MNYYHPDWCNLEASLEIPLPGPAMLWASPPLTSFIHPQLDCLRLDALLPNRLDSMWRVCDWATSLSWSCRKLSTAGGWWPVQPLIWSVVTNRFGTVRGHISGDTNHAPWGCSREILDCCWWLMFKPPGLVTHTPSMFWLKLNVRWLESMEICAGKPFHKWLAWCYLVANYPRLVSGLVHPSFWSGLTRSKNPMYITGVK